MSHAVTCTAPVNIAVIKYWGKRDEELILPINSSLSGTLSQDQLHARTSVMARADFASDAIWLNGKQESIENPRLQNCLREIRKLAAAKQTHQQGAPLPTDKVHICSVNNFPTAAGLASSAAGYACLVYALAQLYKVGDSLAEVTKLARVGSGSACRSIYGGWVRWVMGEAADGSDSIAEQVVDEHHWPEIEVLILVVSDHKKTTSSTAGMQTTVETSSLVKHRADKVVPQRMEDIQNAIRARDFETFGRITMQDSNQFHAVCLDTYPPITYLNDVSRGIIDMLTKYNAHKGKIQAAYTFDAGPNAVIYLPRENVNEVVNLVRHFFPPAVGAEAAFVRGFRDVPAAPVDAATLQAINRSVFADSLKYVMHTRVGSGPQVLSNDADCLLDASGNPRL
ncbi:diphosphomevalonate decarboxylase [Capsaspora owczarzaki ATCC 30864]|uniref:Diphosphomevalonate decarboxylase n=1 Tax=Capsaspora owczarzaki (strain ATCC 30864) TaxID=595528 RepID=A0A0D2WTJ3_CAPO3|nr:diphosphomevalonate decarboxylase [Capsaspora owczarzaki ATCC 30864]KJE94983.1 diphosphomevalonate decarboxylase, variant 1 [Capsaspora owczarzaki ATCC 30864]|eukprot:XP_004346191.2 diphosphomevalonate decarboxylase [Capsaspora owczarzaki ATCC 30864]